jgi:hypothetical protein
VGELVSGQGSRDPLRRIVRAWRDPGPRPDVHRAAVAKLRREWPTLATAIETAADEPASDGTVRLTLEDLRHLFDLAVDSPTVCSGSFETIDVELLRKIATVIGIEPNTITPSEFLNQYRHDFVSLGVPGGCRVNRCGKPADHPIHVHG